MSVYVCVFNSIKHGGKKGSWNGKKKGKTIYIVENFPNYTPLEKK